MVDKTLEELTRDQLWEELRVRNQPVGGSKEQLKERLTKCLEEEGLDPATETFEVEDAKRTPDRLSQILVLGDVRKTSIFFNIDFFDVFFHFFKISKVRRNSGNIFKKILITSRDVSNITILKLQKIYLRLQRYTSD